MKIFILAKGYSPRARNIAQISTELKCTTKLFILKNHNYFKVLKELNRFRPDVIFTLNGPDLIGLPVVWYKLFNRVKFVWDVRSTSALNAKRFWWYYPLALILEKMIPLFADKITTNILKYHKKFGWQLIPQYVDIDLFRPNIINNATKSKRKKVILFVGHLVKKEGVYFLINAFKNYNKKNVELWIIGDGKEESKLHKLAQNDNRIKFFGFRSHDRIPKYIASSDICVIPYPDTKALKYTSLYSVLKVGEYLAMHKPILCSDVGDIKDTAKGTNITFYKADCERDFINKVDYLLSTNPKTKLPFFLKKTHAVKNLKLLLQELKVS